MGRFDDLVDGRSGATRIGAPRARPTSKANTQALNEKRGFPPAVILTEEPRSYEAAFVELGSRGAPSAGAEAEPSRGLAPAGAPARAQDATVQGAGICLALHRAPRHHPQCVRRSTPSGRPPNAPPLSSRGDEAVAFGLPKVSTPCRARVFGFPGGLPSDVGLFLTWAG